MRSRDKLSSEGGVGKCTPISSLSSGGSWGGGKSLEKLLTGPFLLRRSHKFSPIRPFLFRFSNVCPGHMKRHLTKLTL